MSDRDDRSDHKSAKETREQHYGRLREIGFSREKARSTAEASARKAHEILNNSKEPRS